MSSVTFSAGVGGDGSTVTDDSNATTGLANGGHRTRFVPALGQVVAVAANTVTKATEAAASAAAALASESAAASSASAAASQAAALVGTSTTSLVIAVASKTFTTQASKQFNVGQFVIAVSAANPANYMFGQVTSYSSTTLVVDVQAVGGSGTHPDWTISIAGVRGATGATGTGITEQTTGFTATGGTTPKTLTVDDDVTATNIARRNVANDFNDTAQSRAMLKDCGYTFVDKGNSGTSTQTLDYTAGSHQKITATGNHTIATSNWPPTGNLGVILLELVNGGAYTITWPTVNWVKPDGTTTTTFSTWIAAVTGRTALQSSGTDFIRLISSDAGTTIRGGFAL